MRLKPCPFCGRPAKLLQTERQTVRGTTIAGWFVICGNARCSCRTLEFLTPERAVKTWNRRAEG